MSVARDHMTPDPVTVTPDQDVTEAMKTMLARGISGVPVVDGRGNLVGLLTQRDCLTVAYRAGYHGQLAGKVEEFMAKQVETIPAGMPLVEVIERFYNSRYRRFPVMDGNRLVGQISRRDVLRAVLELA